MRKVADPVTKILSNIIKQPNGCWFYNGYRNKDGYGTLSIGPRTNRKYLRCHRIIFEHFKGTIGDFDVCHTCDNPPCCNPDHLFLGTAQDNATDKAIKGRSYITWGEKSGNHKLKTKDIEKIRSDKRKLIDIAEDFGVAKSTISMVKNFKSRKYE